MFTFFSSRLSKKKLSRNWQDRILFSLSLPHIFINWFFCMSIRLHTALLLLSKSTQTTLISYSGDRRRNQLSKRIVFHFSLAAAQNIMTTWKCFESKRFPIETCWNWTWNLNDEKCQPKRMNPFSSLCQNSLLLRAHPQLLTKFLSFGVSFSVFACLVWLTSFPWIHSWALLKRGVSRLFSVVCVRAIQTKTIIHFVLHWNEFHLSDTRFAGKIVKMLNIFKKFQKQNPTENGVASVPNGSSANGYRPMGANLQKKFARGIQYNSKLPVRVEL